MADVAAGYTVDPVAASEDHQQDFNSARRCSRLWVPLGERTVAGNPNPNSGLRFSCTDLEFAQLHWTNSGSVQYKATVIDKEFIHNHFQPVQMHVSGHEEKKGTIESYTQRA
jgi:hypothetical protein